MQTDSNNTNISLPTLFNHVVKNSYTTNVKTLIYDKSEIPCQTYFRMMSQNCNIYQVIRAARSKCDPFSKCVSLIGGQASLEYGDTPDVLTKGACGIRFIRYA